MASSSSSSSPTSSKPTYLEYTRVNTGEKFVLPIVESHISVNVDGKFAEMKFSYTFANYDPELKTPCDGTFSFPLFHGCMIRGMTMTCEDGTVIRGVILPLKKAQQQYNEAKKEHKTCSMVSYDQQDQEERFTMAVNIRPQQKLVVELELLVMMVCTRSNKYTLPMPQEMFPKYQMVYNRIDMDNEYQLENEMSPSMTMTTSPRPIKSQLPPINESNFDFFLNELKSGIARFLLDDPSSSSSSIFTFPLFSPPYPITFSCQVKTNQNISSLVNLSPLKMQIIHPGSIDHPYEGKATFIHHPETSFILTTPRQLTSHNSFSSINVSTDVIKRQSNCLVSMDISLPSLEEEEEEGQMPLLLNPHIGQDQNIVILIDQSGSMDGPPLECAKNAAHAFLSSLPLKCRFNVVAFNDDFTICFDQFVEYNDINLAKAREFIDLLNAEGGTEIYNVLRYLFRKMTKKRKSRVRVRHSTITTITTLADLDAALNPNNTTILNPTTTVLNRVPNPTITTTTPPVSSSPPSPPPTTTPTQNENLSVFVMTDGSVDDVQSIVAWLDEESKERKSPFSLSFVGIGNGVSHFFCDSVSRAGHGLVDYVQDCHHPDDPQMAEIVARQLGCVLHGGFTVELGFEKSIEEGKTISVLPRLSLPSVFSSSKITIYPGSTVHVMFDFGDEDLTHCLSTLRTVHTKTGALVEYRLSKFNDNNNNNNFSSLIPIFFVWYTIKDYEKQIQSSRDSSMIDKLIDLSIQYRVLFSKTAFLAVREGETNVPEFIPTSPPSQQSLLESCTLSTQSVQGKWYDACIYDLDDLTNNDNNNNIDNNNIDNNITRSQTKHKKPASSSSSLGAILSLCNVNGSWKWDDVQDIGLFYYPELDWSSSSSFETTLEAKLPVDCVIKGKSKDCLATILMILILKTFFATSKPAWRLCLAKSKQYLIEQSVNISFLL